MSSGDASITTCAQLPELRTLKLDEWPTQLAIEVEVAFADESLPEDERAARAEQFVLSYLFKGDRTRPT